MPSKSKKQQKFFRLVQAIQEGKAEGSDRAREAARTMNPEDVRDFAMHLELPEDSEDTDMNKQADGKKTVNRTTLNNRQHLNNVLFSTLGGLGIAGGYGLMKYLGDRKAIPEEIEKQKKEMKQVSRTSDKSKVKKEVKKEEEPAIEKTSSEEETFTEGLGKDVGFSALHGMITPLAIIAPGLLSFHFAKKYIDKKRNKDLDKQVQDAKTEFEMLLASGINKDNADQNSLKNELDSLYGTPLTKTAGWGNYFETIFGFGPTYPVEAPRGSPVISNKEDGSKEEFKKFGPAASIPGAAWVLGTLAGVSGLGTYLWLSNKFKDKDSKVIKALKNTLRKDLTAQSLETGVDIEEDDQGNKFVNL